MYTNVGNRVFSFFLLQNQSVVERVKRISGVALRAPNQ